MTESVAELMWSVGDVEQLSRLLRSRKSTHAENHIDQLARFAAFKGCLQTLKLLLSQFNTCSTRELLDIASCQGHLSVVKWIIEDFEGTADFSGVAYKASYHNQFDVALYLLRKTKNKDREEDVLLVCNEAAERNNVSVLDHIRIFYKPDATRLRDALIRATKVGALQCLQWFITYCAVDVSTQTKAFSIACGYGNLEVAQYLYSVNRGVSLTSHDSNCLLIRVCNCGYTRIAEWLLQMKIATVPSRFHEANRYHDLWKAAYCSDSVEMIGWCISLLKVNVRKRGHDALSYAIKYNHWQVVKFLIKKGVSVSRVNSEVLKDLVFGYHEDTKTALWLFRRGVPLPRDAPEIAMLWCVLEGDLSQLQRYALKNYFDRDDALYALHLACLNNKVGIVDYLLKGGFLGTLNEVELVKAANLAVKADHLDTVQYLMSVEYVDKGVYYDILRTAFTTKNTSMRTFLWLFEQCASRINLMYDLGYFVVISKCIYVWCKGEQVGLSMRHVFWESRHRELVNTWERIQKNWDAYDLFMTVLVGMLLCRLPASAYPLYDGNVGMVVCSYVE